MDRTIAIVPMRHKSERVPDKNHRKLAGKPLFHYIVSTLLNVPQIDEVVIDTDSDQILSDAANSFPDVRLLRRPASLTDGHIAMTDVLRNALPQLNSTLVLQTHSTNPFLRAETLSAALTHYAESKGKLDSLFSVTKFQARFWNDDGTPHNHDPQVMERTQDIHPLYMENSCFFIFEPAVLQLTGRRIGDRPGHFEVSAMEAIDIDTPDEWELADAVATGRLRR